MNAATPAAHPECVLFDLDGTLVDTAPDMGGALNRLLAEHDREPIALEKIRPLVSNGSRGLLGLGFGVAPGEEGYDTLCTRFLDIYRNALAIESRLFPGMDKVLEHLENQDTPWGIVTNKPGWLTNPLLEDMQLASRAACVVSGDTLEQNKPHPAPMHHACEIARVTAANCVYVGDAERDIEAGRRAGMFTMVAKFGYIPEDENPDHWQADIALNHSDDLLRWLQATVK